MIKELMHDPIFLAGKSEVAAMHEVNYTYSEKKYDT
jgi:hypothetical protein